MDGGHASKLTIASTCAASARATGSAAERPPAVADGCVRDPWLYTGGKTLPDIGYHLANIGTEISREPPRRTFGPACAPRANRGAKDVPIVYCGGLSGFPEAIEATLLDVGASPAEVITKHVEHWQRNYFRECHCKYS